MRSSRFRTGTGVTDAFDHLFTSTIRLFISKIFADDIVTNRVLFAKTTGWLARACGPPATFL